MTASVETIRMRNSKGVSELVSNSRLQDSRRPVLSLCRQYDGKRWANGGETRFFLTASLSDEIRTRCAQDNSYIGFRGGLFELHEIVAVLTSGSSGRGLIVPISHGVSNAVEDVGVGGIRTGVIPGTGPAGSNLHMDYVASVGSRPVTGQALNVVETVRAFRGSKH